MGMRMAGVGVKKFFDVKVAAWIAKNPITHMDATQAKILRGF